MALEVLYVQLYCDLWLHDILNIKKSYDEQETLDELGNVSETEFEIPATFDEQVCTSSL